MVSKEEIKKIASLSQLDADEKLLEQVQKILNFVKEIEKFELDVDSTEEFYTARSKWRDDEVLSPVERFNVDSEKLIDTFPEKQDRFLRVPHILRKE